MYKYFILFGSFLNLLFIINLILNNIFYDFVEILCVFCVIEFTMPIFYPEQFNDKEKFLQTLKLFSNSSFYTLHIIFILFISFYFLFQLLDCSWNTYAFDKKSFVSTYT